MISPPLNIILTVAFLFTASVCVGNYVAIRRQAAAGEDARTSAELVDINHTVMSAAMILMIWSAIPSVGSWLQIVVFMVFAFALVWAFLDSRATASWVDTAGHVVLNIAMVWMLAAMPLLMTSGAAEHSSNMAGSQDHGTLEAAATTWVDVMNGVVVAFCATGALWWLYQTLRARGHRLHSLCHTIMASGMIAMLLVM
ncbi:hypothetical protein BHE97_19180 [Aeromicrobium sp. PE09-221]|uniref:DUF5134 domain-containing protein n=1 Tax=Aeromicrobium sp. PE09-221 TaxID=1898043 RepID=UPI000B750E7C|nr:DUF5134 domain-containing protein [Aeromicrobium sp. PE09-221]OUZ06327.1 hypothetical protein BHE97_19180 [Aeromicrobium sp. PE09-221]